MRNVAFDLLVRKIRKSDINSLIIGKQTNVRYITGFTGDYGFAAIGLQDPVFFTTPLFSEHARSTVKSPFKVVEVKNSVFEAMADLGVSFWGKRTGFEADTITCSGLEKLRSAFKNIELVPTTEKVEAQRMVKKPSEIKRITRAQRIAESVFEEILEFVREGVEERDLACEIDYRIRKRGGKRSAFETIVAFGPNSSKPHASPSEKKLKAGDIVLFDMGTVYDGYASDMTRTLVFGKADSKLKKIYSTVLDAQETALQHIRSGMKCSEADSLARTVITKAGYGDQFVHSLGHGVGLEVHENPPLSHNSGVILEKNMVVTVEPGIYIPGWGGIRIEDLVVVTDKGCTNLTRIPRILLEI